MAAYHRRADTEHFGDIGFDGFHYDGSVKTDRETGAAMNERDFVEIWVYLSASPLTGLTMTLVCYLAAYFIYQKSGYNSLLNPVLIAVVLIVTVLWTTGTKYLDYFEGAQFIHFLLGPATVALAVPLYLSLIHI